MIVRQATLDDIDSILRIKEDPKVSRFQYRADKPSYSEFLKRVLKGDNVTGTITSHYSIIEKENVAIGYVRHDHYFDEDTKCVYCAWNLSSSHWGHGITRFALTELINGWIFESNVQHVFADHFRKNQRCRKLLNRLGFITQKIPLSERISNALQQKCLQWIVRRRLDAKTWIAMSETANGGLGSRKEESVELH